MYLNNLIYFIGGIGLFLYGTRLMSDGLELSTGAKLKRVLQILTTNKILGVLAGFIITAIVQSSTAVTVMVVGFVNAGLLSLTQAVGVIIGSNVGSATTSALIALNIHNISPLFVFIGTFMLLFTKKKSTKYIGMIIAGFGLLFLGIKIMTDAMSPLSDLRALTNIFEVTANPFFGILVGFILTVLVNSSTASIGIILVIITSGVIKDLNQIIFILYGQNLGACLSAVIASLGLNDNAKRAALIHFVYNFIGISIFTIITLLPLGFLEFIRGLSSNVTNQLVITHILINILMAIILLPFSKYIVKITGLFIKSKEEESTDADFVYIEERLIEQPSFAIVQTYKEIERLTVLALENFQLTKTIILQNSKNSSKIIKKIQDNKNIINLLSGKINTFLTELSTADLEYSDAKLVATLYHVITDIERLGRHSINICRAYEEVKSLKEQFSPDALKELTSMFNNVERAFVKAISVFTKGTQNNKIIAEVSAIERLVDKENETYKNNHIQRSKKGICSSKSGVAFVKILTALERISDYSCNIAYAQYKRNN